MTGPRIVCLGEAMIEHSRDADGRDRFHYGGDTLNSAIHMARLGYDVAYATALGSDAESARLKAVWADEGLDTSLLLEHPDRTFGRYTIALDTAGERSFSYDRSKSAARAMFDCASESWQGSIVEADLLVFSLVSLAILSEEDRGKLIDLAEQVRANGGKVAFDGNYRERLWAGTGAARQWRDRAIAQADFGLPTLDDEWALGGVSNAAEVAARWVALGCNEVVVKQGEHGCLLPGGELVPPAKVVAAVDTSGAGDAFDAGYLAARVRGIAPAESAKQGHRVAGWTILRHGAIPPRDRDYPAAI